MPTYRRARFIGDTVRSVLSQTFSDFELLIRDDGDGSDGTAEAVASAAARDPRVKYHRNPASLRMPGNLNAGIIASVGEYVAVCHDHDLLEPDYLAHLIELLDEHPSALYAHCAIRLIDQDGSDLGAQIGPWPEFESGKMWRERLLASFSCPVCALSMVRRSAHERYGLYHPAHGFFADVELWMRLASVGDVAFSKEPLIRVRTREDDHPAVVDPWPQLALVFGIHRHHLSTFRGLERLNRTIRFLARADLVTVRTLGSELKRKRGLPPTARRLRPVAGPLGRLLALVC